MKSCRGDADETDLVDDTGSVPDDDACFRAGRGATGGKQGRVDPAGRRTGSG